MVRKYSIEDVRNKQKGTFTLSGLIREVDLEDELIDKIALSFIGDVFVGDAGNLIIVREA